MIRIAMSIRSESSIDSGGSEGSAKASAARSLFDLMPPGILPSPLHAFEVMS
jgi:hypothetical protein